MGDQEGSWPRLLAPLHVKEVQQPKISPCWEILRHNLWLRGPVFARPLSNITYQSFYPTSTFMNEFCFSHLFYVYDDLCKELS